MVIRMPTCQKLFFSRRADGVFVESDRGSTKVAEDTGGFSACTCEGESFEGSTTCLCLGFVVCGFWEDLSIGRAKG